MYLLVLARTVKKAERWSGRLAATVGLFSTHVSSPYGSRGLLIQVAGKPSVTMPNYRLDQSI